MNINEKKCVGCGNCHAVCVMGAISLNLNGKSVVNQDNCVECSTCYRTLKDEGYTTSLMRAVRSVLSLFHLQYLAPVDVCPTGALEPPKLEYPRNLRATFSDPTVVHPETGIGGRGTEEIKTNDVTGRLGPGEAGIVVELGRPGTGAYFRDVQTVAMALAPLAPEFEPNNPVTQLMEDLVTGKLRGEVLDEKVISAIIEAKTILERIPDYLSALQAVQSEIDTVFSVAVASRCLPDGSVPHQRWVAEAGYSLSPNGKTNLGLGRPLHRDVLT